MTFPHVRALAGAVRLVPSSIPDTPARGMGRRPRAVQRPRNEQSLGVALGSIRSTSPDVRELGIILAEDAMDLFGWNVRSFGMRGKNLTPAYP